MSYNHTVYPYICLERAIHMHVIAKACHYPSSLLPYSNCHVITAHRINLVTTQVMHGTRLVQIF